MDTTKLELGIIGDFLTGSFSAHPSPLKGEEGLGPRPGRFSDPSARADALKVEAVEDFTAEPPAPLDPRTCHPEAASRPSREPRDQARLVLQRLVIHGDCEREVAEKIARWIKSVFTKDNMKRFVHKVVDHVGAEGRIRTDASFSVALGLPQLIAILRGTFDSKDPTRPQPLASPLAT